MPCDGADAMASRPGRCPLPASTLDDVDRQPAARGFLVLVLMSRPVSRMVLMTLSRRTRCVPSPRRAMRAALIALTAPIALRSMHGICTRPPIGSQVRPRLCSMPISAAFSTCWIDAAERGDSAPAAIEQATPTSPWQPTSAPEIDAFSLYRMPIAPAVSRKSMTPLVRSRRARNARSNAARPG